MFTTGYSQENMTSISLSRIQYSKNFASMKFDTMSSALEDYYYRPIIYANYQKLSPI